ncbi:MAG: NTP transferase domain-containing protein [Candidatus Delongbacteria bacterium]|nr:NTP transferase domain-containing protein [Candidatus Delongbacteria bacterium]
MKLVIIAAGMGSRLWEIHRDTPKTLMPYQDGTLLSHILANFYSVGISEFVLIVGYMAQSIVDYCKTQFPESYRFEFVHNPDWQKPNGISVYMARSCVMEQDFLISMSDHLVSPGGLSAIIRTPADSNRLLVDQAIGDVFDLDDATKVKTEGTRIVEIGKTIPEYNGIDCGVFKLTHRFFSAMEDQIRQGKESLSNGVQALIARDDFGAEFLPAGNRWVDVDTPEAYRYAGQHPEWYR